MAKLVLQGEMTQSNDGVLVNRNLPCVRRYVQNGGPCAGSGRQGDIVSPPKNPQNPVAVQEGPHEAPGSHAWRCKASFQEVGRCRRTVSLPNS